MEKNANQENQAKSHAQLEKEINKRLINQMLLRKLNKHFSLKKKTEKSDSTTQKFMLTAEETEEVKQKIRDESDDF